MNEVHCAVLIRFSIRLLCFLGAVYHRGNCHLDVLMWGRWEVKMCYSRQDGEIVGLIADQNNGRQCLIVAHGGRNIFLPLLPAPPSTTGSEKG